MEQNLQKITMSKSKSINLINWYNDSKKYSLKEKIFPLKDKEWVFTTRQELLIELEKREMKFSLFQTKKLIKILKTYFNNDFCYENEYSLFSKRKEIIDKKIFISLDSENNEIFRIQTLLKEIRKRKIDLKKINTKQLLSWYKNNRFEEGYQILDNFPDKQCLIHVIELKKELNTREHILDKNINTKIRKICSEKKVSKEEAYKLLNKEIKK